MTVAVPAYRVPQYRRYVAGEAVSVLGDQIWYVALSWAAVELASPGVAGVVLALSAVPRLLLMVLGGPLADRFDARRLMVGSDALRAMIMLLAAGIAVTATELWLLVVVALIFGAVDAVFMPAAGSLRPRLLETEQLSDGAALRELGVRAALMLGAPLGGALVTVGGLALACAANAVTFVVSLLAIRTLNPRPIEQVEEREPYGAALRAGLRYLVSHKVLLPLMLVTLLFNIGFVGPMNLGLALLSEERGWGANGIGFLLAGFGVGAAVGAVVMLRVRIRHHIGIGIAACAVGEAVGISGATLAPDLGLAVASTVLVGLLGGPLGILCGSLSQANTDDAFRGRTSSVQALLTLGVTPLVMAAVGWLAGEFGTTPVMLASAAVEASAALPCLLLARLRTASVTSPGTR
ncbi:MFS transporter [Allokutzneria albata]|uniref:Transmembrane secretion effector n=1 Tax=Allokutzneria albata TaxID=211114 RepID=A0A1G9TNY1_ALLAB|nr:MFS transporter [Allokutzneria albata]SDM49400.1 Transmembrane secretion effector [Allokutzneria albata]